MIEDGDLYHAKGMKKNGGDPAAGSPTATL
jgi:hypothetical protein